MHVILLRCQNAVPVAGSSTGSSAAAMLASFVRALVFTVNSRSLMNLETDYEQVVGGR
jgi:homoserine kinase